MSCSRDTSWFSWQLGTPQKPSAAAPVAAPSSKDSGGVIAKVNDDRNNLNAGDSIILIIEDDERFAKVLLDLCREKGFKGIIALNGKDGIHLALEHEPIGIMLDVQLPLLDGWGVMTHLKENPQTRHIPVHFISVEEHEPRAMRMGAIGYLTNRLQKKNWIRH